MADLDEVSTALRAGGDTVQHPASLPYYPLSDADVQKVLQATFQLLREIGVKFDPHPRAFDLFSGAGCDISDAGLVKFPTELVEASLDSAARSAKLWNRPGTALLELRPGHTSFVAGITALNVIDFETRERRPATQEDLARIVRVADALPDLDGVTIPCKPGEKSNVLGEVEEFALLSANTTKPLEYLSQYAEALEGAIEIAAAIRGGSPELREKPYFVHSVTPLPLEFARPHLDQITLAIDNGIPLFVGTGGIGGASTPVTVAASLVHAFATDFAGLVLSQLIEKGCFCMGGAAIGFIDPTSGNIGSVAETALAEAAKCQIARFLGLPIGAGNAGANKGHDFNQDSISLAVSSMIMAVHTRPTLCDYLGLMESGLTYSLHSLLFCHELTAMVRRLWRGIRVDDDTLALDVTRAVGPGGDYLGNRHTIEHCRSELWNSRYFRSITYEVWEQGGKKELVDRIDEDLRRILETHEPETLSASIRRRVDCVLSGFRET